MSAFRRFLGSTVGAKVVVAASGLLLLLFLVEHAIGNLLVFADGGAFNRYAHALTRNKLILYTAEAGLAAVFLVHIVNAVRVTVRNRAARPVGYERKRLAGPPSRKSVASSSMIVSGAILTVFLVLHIKTFRLGPWYAAAEPGMRDLHRLVVEVFSRPAYVAFYVAAMVVLALHLRHGVASAFQSLGADHPSLTPKVLRFGLAAAILLGLLFAAIPIGVFVWGGAA